MSLPSDLPLLLALTLAVALLYSTVGHGGASGYLAAMSLVGIAPAEMKPTALLLNVLVAGIGSVRYMRSGSFSAKAFLPFALGSIPFAFVGGASVASDPLYKKILGVVLVVAAARMLWSAGKDQPSRNLPFAFAVVLGAGIGYVSGLIGVGGGIFLSPLLILMGWATTRETMGVSALFIFVNSIAGLGGMLGSLQGIPDRTYWLAPAALLGGVIGTELGARKFGVNTIRWALAVVLLIAAGKALFA